MVKLLHFCRLSCLIGKFIRNKLHFCIFLHIYYPSVTELKRATRESRCARLLLTAGSSLPRRVHPSGMTRRGCT